MHTLAITLAVLAAVSQDQGDRMIRLATADQPIAQSAVINAPVREVWKAWTTTEGIKSWMVAEGTVDLSIGGKYRTSYTKGSDLTGPDVIENTILAYDPERMITIKNTRSPERFPFKKAMESVWTVIYLSPEGEKTRVTVRMIGFTHDKESQDMKAFFERGNQATLDALAKRFSK